MVIKVVQGREREMISEAGDGFMMLYDIVLAFSKLG